MLIITDSFVSEVRPLVDGLIGAQFHVSDALYQQVLVLTNEAG